MNIFWGTSLFVVPEYKRNNHSRLTAVCWYTVKAIAKEKLLLTLLAASRQAADGQSTIEVSVTVFRGPLLSS